MKHLDDRDRIDADRERALRSDRTAATRKRLLRSRTLDEWTHEGGQPPGYIGDVATLELDAAETRAFDAGLLYGFKGEQPDFTTYLVPCNGTPHSVFDSYRRGIREGTFWRAIAAYQKSGACMIEQWTHGAEVL